MLNVALHSVELLRGLEWTLTDTVDLSTHRGERNVAAKIIIGACGQMIAE